MESSHKDPITLHVMDLKLKNWPNNFEATDEYLRGLQLQGYKDHTLSYIYCLEICPALAAINPATSVVRSR